VNRELLKQAVGDFQKKFGSPHTVSAYAPGRVEILGNHTDYNDGFVLSSAINFGIFFLAAKSKEKESRIFAGNMESESRFSINSIIPSQNERWANYIKGVLAGLSQIKKPDSEFNALILGDIPLGSGLSSSAALEIASGLALARMFDIKTDNITLAKIGQKAEHDFAGANCGLLDQISSIAGKEHKLVFTDFRTLEIKNIHMSSNVCFLVCHTDVKHAHVDNDYNERRRECEKAAHYFAGALNHPVKALRDVRWDEWQEHSQKMDPMTAKRSAHPIGENARVLRGIGFLEEDNIKEFGQLMYDSHQSSISYFENSCPELDFIVQTANDCGAYGARLSGGGFGGSAVVMTSPDKADEIRTYIESSYGEKFGNPCETHLITPSDGAKLLD